MSELILNADRISKTQVRVVAKDLIGLKAPEFSLLNDEGELVESSSFNGQRRLLFFYARDGSPNCKRGCLNFREQYDLFRSAGCEIIGISEDPVEDHRRFKKELGGLTFPLLSDKGREVADMYGVPRNLGLFPGKSSFLINEQDEITHVYDWYFRPRRHVARILAALSAITNEA